MKKEELYFQPTPSTEVADMLYELGQKIKKEYDEPILGEFIITQAINYRTGTFQSQWEDFQEFMQAVQEQEELREPRREARDRARKGRLVAAGLSRDDSHRRGESGLLNHEGHESPIMQERSRPLRLGREDYDAR